MVYDSNFVTFCKGQSYGDSKKDQEVSGVNGEEGINR